MFLELPEKYHSIRQHVKYHKDVSTSIGLKIVMVSDKSIIPVHSWFWLCFEIDVKYRSALGDFEVYVEPSNLWENPLFVSQEGERTLDICMNVYTHYKIRYIG